VLVSAHGVQLLPGLNGSYLLATLGPAARRDAFALIESLTGRFDTLVLDIAAGIGATQTAFAGAASDTVVVVTPEPLSMADAYACLKVLKTEQGVDHAYVLPNRVTSRDQADEIVARLGALVDRFLDLELIPLPGIPADPHLSESARAGIPVVIDRPDCPSARAIKNVARALDALVGPERRPDSARRFWHRMFRADGAGDSP
jgi:flagellar biosynthesis protein FlhG